MGRWDVWDMNSDTRENTGTVQLGNAVWHRFLVLIPLAIALVAVCYFHIRAEGATFEAFSWYQAKEATELSLGDVSMGREGVVETTAAEITGLGFMHVSLHALGDGATTVTAGRGNDAWTWDIEVRDGVVIEDGINFSGWKAIHLSLVVMSGATCALFASVFFQLWKNTWYGYKMVASGAGMLFTFFHFLLFFLYYARGSLREFRSFLNAITGASEYFALGMLFPLGVMAVLLALSNVSLIRREGFRPVNLLGIVAGVLMALTYYFWDAVRDWLVRSGDLRPLATYFNTLMAMTITYGECILFSIIVCALLACRHEPKQAADFTIILGCGIRDDGTPSPLLAGRVDRALAFDQKHVAQGAAPTTFVPSGGQGPNEVMSEGESMRNYLVGKGVDPLRIAPETRSATTRENMIFSRAVIEAKSNDHVSSSRVAFSTTNYHVFRGYVCAHQAGMAAEGMGSKTRLYFWPNAFLRETVGVVAARWKGILLVYVAISFVYMLADFILAQI